MGKCGEVGEILSGCVYYKLLLLPSASLIVVLLAHRI